MAHCLTRHSLHLLTLLLQLQSKTHPKSTQEHLPTDLLLGTSASELLELILFTDHSQLGQVLHHLLRAQSLDANDFKSKALLMWTAPKGFWKISQTY
jgi:hypothetical protein